MSKSANTIPLPLEYIPSNRLGDIDFSDTVSLTKQSEADSCDINSIMATYERTGMLTHANRFQGQYADLGDGLTYHEAMNQIIHAQEAFDTLPAKVRERFNNDPATFLDFVNDPANLPEMAKMGLLDEVPSSAAREPQTAEEPPTKVPPQEEAKKPAATSG